MMIPKAVVFDLGKVLLDFDYGIAISKIQRRCRLTERELHTLINQSPLLLQYETNLLSTAEFFAHVQAASGFCGDLVEFRSLFADIFSPIEPMVRLHGQLHDAGVSTYIFSNTNDIAIGHIRARFPFFQNFNGYVLSYEHNAMKPDAKLYEVVERTTGWRGAALLYIDDRPENIAAGQERDWQVILHEDPLRTEQGVRHTGLLA